MAKLVVYTLENDSVKKYKKLPKWLKSILLDEESGEIWIPAVLAGNEKTVMLCAGWDNTGIAMYKKHLYCKLTWMEKEFVVTRDVCNSIKKQMKPVVEKLNCGVREENGQLAH